MTQSDSLMRHDTNDTRSDEQATESALAGERGSAGPPRFESEGWFDQSATGRSDASDAWVTGGEQSHD